MRGGYSERYDKEEFARRANIIHSNKYDYSLSNYKNSRDKIEIICPIHGSFSQMPYNHLQGKGCHHCSRNQKFNIDDFILRANKKHSGKYTYPDKNYVNTITSIGIMCKDHGIFYQNPGSHLMGIGCPKCSGNRRLSIDEFIDAANKKHNYLYQYLDTNYKNYDSYIQIICPKHGVFNQIVRNHLTGRGCPRCRNSKGELKILEILKVNNMNYKQQYMFPDLKYKQKLKFDFAIFDASGALNYLIEYNGEQHYSFRRKFHRTYDNFIINQYRDKLKIDYCDMNKINLHIIRYDENINDRMSEILN